jgi:phage tail-like protein
MDVNGTPYELCLSEPDWKLGDAPGLEWDRSRPSVILEREQFRFPPPRGSRRLTPAARRGAARDRFGHWFSIGADTTEIRLLRAGTRTSSRYWPVASPEPAQGDFAPTEPERSAPPPRLSGLAVTEHHDLVAGVPSLPGLLLFDLHGGGPPTELRWPFAFAPLDIAAAPGDGLWVLEEARLWRLDRNLRVHNLGGALPPALPADDFGPGEGEPVVDRIVPELALALDRRWLAVEGLPDGSALLLGESEIARVRDGEIEPLAFDASVLRADAHDLAFLPETSTLFVADAEGNQAYAFELAGDRLTPTLAYYPLRLFGGKGLVCAGDAVYYDMGERWIALVDRRTPRYATAGTAQLQFDAGVPGCVWHRAMLDACVPAGTSIALESRAADTPELLEAAAWEREPDPYLRADGPELPGRVPGAGTYETLLQRAAGRLLELRLRVAGNGRRTPRLFALRVYRPRFSYLREYLPDVYQQDPVAAGFLDRYLANPEGTFTTIEGRIAEAQQLYDVRTVDADYLPWLASWLGVALEHDWDEARRRLFIDHLPQLFRERGTRAGMLRMIRLATDACPSHALFEDCGCSAGAFGARIVEAFQTRRAAAVALGDPTELAGPRVVPEGARWTPAQGAAALHARWREYLATLHDDVAADERFPPLPPADPSEWRAFVRDALAVPYEEAGPADADGWRRFLTLRYRRPAELAAAWGRTVVTDFADIELPSALPEQGAELLDWIQFVSIVLATARRAHRFTVLVPVRPQDSDDERARRVSRVERVVLVERPAHTSYEIRPYWAACRVGEARVGLDTVVGEGSRFVAVVLGRDRLATGYLSDPGEPR